MREGCHSCGHTHVCVRWKGKILAYCSLFAREERLSETSLKTSPYSALAQNRSVRHHSGSINCLKNVFIVEVSNSEPRGIFSCECLWSSSVRNSVSDFSWLSWPWHNLKRAGPLWCRMALSLGPSDVSPWTIQVMLFWQESHERIGVFLWYPYRWCMMFYLFPRSVICLHWCGHRDFPFTQVGYDPLLSFLIWGLKLSQFAQR